MKIGIPRALIYWKRPYFWESFFENLGFEILLSPKTNKEIVEMGVRVSDPETCFSTKVFFGHLLWLNGKCDLIFVPRLKAVAEASLHLPPRPASRGSVTEEKLEYCPKFFGLPDLAKILVHPVKSCETGISPKAKLFNRVKTPILSETFDERKQKFEKTLEKLGKRLKKNKEETKKAAEIAFLKEKDLREKENKIFFERINSKRKKIVLISHPYNLYDDYVNLRMRDKLEKLGAEVIFIDEVPENRSRNTLIEDADLRRKISAFNQRNYQRQSASTIKFHWEFGKEIMAKIEEILKYDTCPVRNRRFSNGVSGAVEISSFACGCDAVLKEFVEREFKKNKIPFLYLIIDEHTGEAGFQTRIEAFIDTLGS